VAIRLSALFVYPVKACRGIRVERAEVAERGFACDRRWMITDDSGTFVTQREVPRLALVRTEIGAASLRLDAPGAGEVEIPLADPEGKRCRVRVWRHEGAAVAHAEGSAFFSRFLGAPHRLVYMPDDVRRAVNPEHARPGDVVSFADGYPFLLASQSSLADLNARLARPIEIERFRPNLVIAGAPPYAEDDFTRLEIGGVRFRAAKRCDRCAVTTVDPRTGERGPEPLATLATFRKQAGKVWFGVNLVHEGRGTVRVGDEVRTA
jgi:uncharacterized protein YcbX